jgi:hypothetical protein
MTVFLPIRAKASPKPTVVVVLPSPAGVGDMAVTKTILAFAAGVLILTFALKCPNGISSSCLSPSFSAICVMGSIFAAWAISMSERMDFSPLIINKYFI